MTNRTSSFATAFIFFIGLLLMFASQGCGLLKGEDEQIVCDPFGTSTGRASLRHGAGGVVYTFTSPQMQQNSSVMNLQKNGKRVKAVVYLNSFNILPTRFNEGFPVAGGGRLRANGSVLTEYFSLHFESVLKLGPDQEPGNYQFALLSDDGAIMKIQDNGAESVLINDDGVHSASLKCASRTVHFDSETTSVPVKLDYFQGPRDQIALALLWRRIPDDASGLADPACGERGSEVFFDLRAAQATPTPTWTSFIDRGWKLVEPVNFHLPEGFNDNPC